MDGLTEQYNARGSTPEAVAGTFVAPAQFVEVETLRNCVVVGSRGSGKTTLLRMLEPRAQIAWSARLARQNHLSAIGVFVPIDAAWLASLRNLVYRTEINWGRVALAVYSLTVARAVVDAMLFRLSSGKSASHPYGAQMEFASEEVLVEELQRLFPVAIHSRTLLAFRFRITSEIATFPRALAQMSPDGREQALLRFADPVSLAAAACELFNTAVGESDRRWILLCDEIEIAPSEIQTMLFGALRATPSPLVLKLAMTPVVGRIGTLKEEQPLPTHDFDPVSLSYSTRDEGHARQAKDEFCRAIWAQLVSDAGEQSFDLQNPFRALEVPNVFARARRRGMEPLPRRRESRALGRQSELFVALAESDKSFAEYLSGKKIDPSRLEDCSPDLLDSVVRKVAPLVELRLFFLTYGRDGPQRSTRRSMSTYTGAHRIFDVSEGHPRWLKATLSGMLAKRNLRGVVPLAVQSNELARSVERLTARIAAFPSDTTAESSTQRVIEVLGAYFTDQVLGHEFRADPYLTFIVDNGVSPDVIRAIENALYIGAVIPMTREPGGMLLDGVVGRRLRLSYWLAPRFRLPLTTGRPIPLSSILYPARRSQQMGLEL